MKKKTYIFLAFIIAILVVAGFFVVMKVPRLNNATRSQFNGVNRQDLNNSQQTVDNNQMPASDVQRPAQPDQQPQQKQTVDPLSSALSRITKKPFGIYVTPKNSPVQPERFTGYHNAVDLETTLEEQNVDVPVKALCDGKLLMVRNASGYGGVAVESCTLDGQAVTVIYGHIRLSSVKAKAGDQLKAGDFLANLGNAYSSETDGERKHLHLGIHKGTGINILGYVQNKSQLDDWIDPSVYLK